MNFLGGFSDPIYFLLRLISGLMFMCHGLDKIFGTFGGKHAAAPLMVVGGWLEILLGLLIAIGLLTSIAAFIASGEMAVAFFMAHAHGSMVPYVNKGELAVLYCFVFLFISAYGGGRWSLDAMFLRNADRPNNPRV